MKMSKNWKITGLILFAVMALFLTASMALAANTVNAIADQKAVQDQEFSYVVTANETQANLSISPTSSLGWLSVDPVNKMTLKGTPDASNFGTQSIKVDVNDANGALNTVTFNLTVVPALEIKKDDSFQIYVNGVQKYGYKNVTANNLELTPGDAVKVQYTYGNNFAAKILGYIVLDAHNQGVDFVKHTISKWSLLSGATYSDSFSFNVPFDYMDGSLVIPMKVWDEDIKDSKYEDNVLLQFTMNNKPKSGFIKNATFDSTNYTCNKMATLTVELVNNGQYSLVPEFWVLNQHENGINPQTGEVVSSSSLKVHYPNDIKNEPKLLKGDKKTIQIPVNVSGLNGAQKIYVYLVSPFVYDATSGKYTFVDKKEGLDINVGTCLNTVDATPKEKNQVVSQAGVVSFTVNANDNTFNNKIQWFVNDTQTAIGNQFDFYPQAVGTYTVKAKLTSSGEETSAWSVTVTNKPLTNLLTTNIPDSVILDQLKVFPAFTVSNAYGKIVYSVPVDLSNVLDLDKAIMISDGKVTVDTTNYPQLDKQAKVTLNKKFTNPIALVTGNNKIISGPTVVGNTVEFTVSGFSTYEVKENTPAGMDVSTVLFDNAVDTNVDLGKTVTKTFTIKNTGTSADLTGINVDASGVNSKYKPVVTNKPDTLTAGQQQSVTLSITIPTDEASGLHSIGTIKVTSGNITKTVDVSLNTKSFLTIDEVKINGKTSGKLNLNEKNEIQVYVLNNYNYDVEDVTVTVDMTVDSNDLTEESDYFNVDKTDTQDGTVTIDLSDETVDQDSYDLDITVEGKGTNGVKQKTTKTVTVYVDRVSHKIDIKDLTISPTELQCSKLASLKVTIENVGKSNEDKVQIKVSNTALGLSQTKDNIKVDKFSGDHPEFKGLFPLDLETAKAGTYQIQVDVLRDGTLDESKTVDLVLKDCATGLTTSKTSTTQNVLADGEMTALLKEQLKQDLQAKQANSDVQRVVKGSFRESDTYTLMLAVLGLLVFIAMVMALMVLVVQRKKN